MAWQEKKPESSRTVGRIYRRLEKRWWIEQHAEKINQQLVCVAQEKSCRLFSLTAINRHCRFHTHICMAKASKIPRLSKPAAPGLSTQASSSTRVVRSWSSTYSCSFPSGALFPVPPKFAKYLTVGWNLPCKMVPPAASKFFHVISENSSSGWSLCGGNEGSSTGGEPPSVQHGAS